MKKFLTGPKFWYAISIVFGVLTLTSAVTELVGHPVGDGQFSGIFMLLTLGLAYLQDIKDTQANRVVVRIERDEAE